MNKETQEFADKMSVEMTLENERRAKNVLKSMNDDYTIAMETIQEQIDAIFGRYLVDNKLDVSKAKQYLSDAKHKTWKKSVKKYMDEILAYGLDSVEGQALWLELETLSAKTRIDRFEQLKSIIVANMAKIACVQQQKITEHLEEIFKDDYYQNMYNAYAMGSEEVLKLMEENKVGVTNSFVFEIITQQWVGSNFIDRVWRNEFNAAFTLNDVITQVLIAGRSPKELAAEIEKKFASDKKTVEALILTETDHVKMESDLYSFEKEGVTMVQYKATLDGRTCSQCSPKDGEIYNIDEVEQGKNKPPMHSRCRCNLVPYDDYLEKYTRKYGTRIARDKKGRNIFVEGDITYDEWSKKYSNKE